MNKIGFYQFDNLVRNRIPFFLINLGQDLSHWYESIFKQHLLVLMNEKIPKDFPIVLLCQNGKESQKTYEGLIRKGYTNVYLIDGGIQQMMTEKE
jgi:rhodanese-related sulfurtransferase